MKPPYQWIPSRTVRVMITVPPQNTFSTFPPKLLTHFNIRNYTDLQAVTDADWDTEVRKLMGSNQQHNLLNKRGVMLYTIFNLRIWDQ